jgi:hypothetical protein
MPTAQCPVTVPTLPTAAAADVVTSLTTQPTDDTTLRQQVPERQELGGVRDVTQGSCRRLGIT